MIRYLEDLTLGERLATGTAVLSEAEMIAFAKLYDPQAIHTDPDRAANGAYRGLIGSGWHTAAVVMRLIAEARPLGDAPILGLGVDELRWPKPVRPGDAIQAEMEIVAITPSRSKPEFGVARIRNVVRDQNGDVVMTMFTNLWVPRRPVA